MATTTGSWGFARILRIWPRLPLPSFLHLSRAKCGGLLPPPFVLAVADGLGSLRASGRQDVLSNGFALSEPRVEQSYTSWIPLVFSAVLISATGCLYYRSSLKV